ncbi:hypothetical protein AB205_0019640 [Aquarana catesbeiana]|uniref:Uncharacterized protein n=1 Tax=Aquarana catesbeiana TaxID=8400 RepID=A0A2G9RNG1_AQUCT|nr:hypothetical protein AB205_0019640 [Aquarana catesbeiana]
MFYFYYVLLYLLCRYDMSYCYTVMLLYFVLLLTIICLAGTPFSCSTDLFILTATVFALTI